MYQCVCNANINVNINVSICLCVCVFMFYSDVDPYDYCYWEVVLICRILLRMCPQSTWSRRRPRRVILLPNPDLTLICYDLLKIFVVYKCMPQVFSSGGTVQHPATQGRPCPPFAPKKWGIFPTCGVVERVTSGNMQADSFFGTAIKLHCVQEHLCMFHHFCIFT